MSPALRLFWASEIRTGLSYRRPDHQASTIARQRSRSQNGNDGLLDFARDPSVVLFNVDVHLAAHAEIGQVDAGFDREARTRNHAAGVVRLEIVHVGAVAMHVFADRVSRAVDEILPVAVPCDHSAGGVVHFPTRESPALPHRSLHEAD